MKKMFFVLALILIPSFVFAGEKVYTDTDLLKYSAKPMIDDESLQNREAGQAKLEKEQAQQAQAQKETKNNLKPKGGIIYFKPCSSSRKSGF